jgi:hypothetical protein
MRAHKPSEGDRACHQRRAARRIAEHLAIDAKTLRKHYARELEFGTETLLSKVLNNFASIAIKGCGLPALSVTKYLLSCRGGYREHSSLEVETGEGLSGLMRACSIDERAATRERILARIAELNIDSADNAREIIAGKLAQLCCGG